MKFFWQFTWPSVVRQRRLYGAYKSWFWYVIAFPLIAGQIATHRGTSMQATQIYFAWNCREVEVGRSGRRFVCGINGPLAQHCGSFALSFFVKYTYLALFVYFLQFNIPRIQQQSQHKQQRGVDHSHNPKAATTCNNREASSSVLFSCHTLLSTSFTYEYILALPLQCCFNSHCIQCGYLFVVAFFWCRLLSCRRFVCQWQLKAVNCDVS